VSFIILRHGWRIFSRYSNLLHQCSSNGSRQDAFKQLLLQRWTCSPPNTTARSVSQRCVCILWPAFRNGGLWYPVSVN
jgi:hypothetical protein